jgi:chloride channel 3/4/5
MWHSFICALVATFTLAVSLNAMTSSKADDQSMDPFRTGKLVLFQVSYDRDWHYFELPAFVLIGIFGVCAILFR